MRVEFEERKVKIVGSVEARQYKMMSSAKAFKSLIGGLYSWPEAACIREALSNAYDSHVKAGCTEVPFELFLPTYDDPYMRVRDYGIGMTREIATEVTTTFFGSTKEDDDTAVGCHGLGFKVPLAISDTMTLTVYTGQERWTFITTLDESHTPQQIEFPAEVDDSPRGVEISFPVEPSRFESFSNAAALILQGFEVKPILSGGAPTAAVMPTIGYDKDGVKLYQSTPPMRKAVPYALQGCVLYPLDRDAIMSAQIDGIHGDEGRVTPEESWVLRENAEISFSIGDLSVPLSRESLEYNKRTLKNIILRVKQIHADCMKVIEDALSQATTPFDKVLAFRDIQHIIPSFKPKPIKMKSFKISNSLEYVYTNAKSIRELITYRRPSGHKTYRRTTLNKSYYHRETLEVIPGKDLLIYFKPSAKTRNYFSRIKFYVENLGWTPTSVYVIPFDKGTFGFKKLWCALGRPGDDDLVDLETLPQPTRAGTHFRSPPKVLRQSYGKFPEHRSLENAGVVSKDFDASEGGVYVSMRGNAFQYFPEGCSEEGFGLTTYTLTSAMNAAIARGTLLHPESGEPITEVVIVNGTHLSVVNKNKDVWFNVVDILISDAESIVDETVQQLEEFRRGTTLTKAVDDDNLGLFQDIAALINEGLVREDELPDVIYLQVAALAQQMKYLEENQDRKAKLERDLCFCHTVLSIKHDCQRSTLSQDIDDTISNELEAFTALKRTVCDNYPLMRRWMTSTESRYSYRAFNQVERTDVRHNAVEILDYMKWVDSQKPVAYDANTETHEEGIAA